MYSLRVQGKFVKARVKWFFLRNRDVQWTRQKLGLLLALVLISGAFLGNAVQNWATSGDTSVYRYSVVREAEAYTVLDAGRATNAFTAIGYGEEGEQSPDPCTLRDVVCDGEAVAEVSAYNADPAQTDADPYTMASGKRVYEGSVANNCLPFGTQVKIGEKTYTVEDRMNSRYGCNHFDIFMWDYNEAVKFGRKQLTFEVL